MAVPLPAQSGNAVFFNYVNNFVSLTLLYKRGALLSGTTVILPHVDKARPPRLGLHA
jgi:hypothetical protein